MGEIYGKTTSNKFEKQLHGIALHSLFGILLFWNGYDLCYTHPMKLIMEHRMPVMHTNNIGLHSWSQCSRDVRRADVRMLSDRVFSTYS